VLFYQNWHLAISSLQKRRYMMPPQNPGPGLSSPQNTRIKALARLMADSAERRRTGSFVLEGAREISRALTHGFKPIEAYGVPSLFESSSDDGRLALRLLEEAGFKPITITTDLFSKVALREGRDGLLVVFKQKNFVKPDDVLSLAKIRKPFLLALQGLEKPGNLGAILRSADGAGVDGVLMVKDSASQAFDRYHPQLMRNSLGAAFSMECAVISSLELPRFCKQHHLQLVAAALTPQAVSLYQADLQAPLVLLLGSEAQGIEPTLLDAANQVIKIPMQGTCDSLNVAAAGAVILYEALRQRLKT
jgi:TrmH family RNA methyltransferase